MSRIARLRLGTRGSLLARTQSGLVADALAALGVQVELVEIVTTGDRRPPDTTWGEGWFVTALREALVAGRIDLAVHSAKDVPIEGVAGLAIAAMPERADPRDALVLPDAAGDPAAGSDPLASLPRGAIVGTDSPRRTGFLRAARPDLRVVPLHGNVDTRLARLDRGEADALVLAVEVRDDDDEVAALVARIDHAPTHLAVRAERLVLETTGGGCRAPVGVLAGVRDGIVELRASAVDPDGGHVRRVDRRGAAGDWARLAADAGRALGRIAVPA